MRLRSLICYQSNYLHHFKGLDVPWCRPPFHIKPQHMFPNSNYQIHFISYIKFKRLFFFPDICITLLFVLSHLHFISYDFHLFQDNLYHLWSNYLYTTNFHPTSWGSIFPSIQGLVWSHFYCSSIIIIINEFNKW